MRDWLRGRSFASTFRPVPLQMLVCECEKLAQCPRRRDDTGVDGPCAPCPETAGSDCSRCDNPPIHPWGRSSFPQPCDGACLAESPSVLDHVIVPETTESISKDSGSSALAR